MTKSFRVGDHVSWNSEAGRVRALASGPGAIRRAGTRAPERAGPTRRFRCLRSGPKVSGILRSVCVRAKPMGIRSRSPRPRDGFAAGRGCSGCPVACSASRVAWLSRCASSPAPPESYTALPDGLPPPRPASPAAPALSGQVPSSPRDRRCSPSGALATLQLRARPGTVP